MNHSYDTQTHETATILNVVGSFDRSDTAIATLVADLAHRPLGRLIISLERCTYCDSSALTTLVRAHKTMQQAMLLIVVPEDSKVRRVFEITGLVKVLRILPTLDSALRTEMIAA